MSAGVVQAGSVRAAAGVYRRQWWRLAAMFAFSGFSGLVLFIVVALAVGRIGAAFSISPVNSGMQATTILLLQLAIGLPWLAGMAAMVAVAHQILEGERPRTLRMYRHGLASSPLLLVGFALYCLAVAAAFVLSYILFLAWYVLLPVAVIALAVWWLRPVWRRAWLKWLIVAAVPFGPLLYVIVSWSMWMPAMVLEGSGPIRAVTRSRRVVRSHWFAVAGVEALSLVALLVVNIPVTLAMGALLTALGGSSAAAQAPGAGVGLTMVFFGGVPMVVLTVMFSRLRERAASD